MLHFLTEELTIYLEIRLGIAFLCVDEAREENGVSHKEDRGVVPYQVPVAFFSVKLDSEPSWISETYLLEGIMNQIRTAKDA